MNEHANSDPASAEPSARRVMTSRRHFAKAGAAAPVVMGSLMSKSALGAPYLCTVSGQVSGNMSSHPGGKVNCKVGLSHGYWKNHDWPAGGPTRGSLPTGTNCAVTGSVFNGLKSPDGTALKDSFWSARVTTTVKTTTTNSKTGQITSPPTTTTSCSYTAATTKGTNSPPSTTTTSSTKKGVTTKVETTTATQWGGATMLEVLNMGGGGVVELGRETVGAILNALQFKDQFGVTVDQIVKMFNAVAGGGVYMVNGSVPWDQSKVTAYFKSLHD